MCYVHNQWYDISCATLYVSLVSDKISEIKLEYSTLLALKSISEPIMSLLNSVCSTEISFRKMVFYIFLPTTSRSSARFYTYK